MSPVPAAQKTKPGLSTAPISMPPTPLLVQLWTFICRYYHEAPTIFPLGGGLGFRVQVQIGSAKDRCDSVMVASNALMWP